MSILKEIALNYHNCCGFNVLPLNGKTPIIPWDKWQSKLQTTEDVKRMNWRSASGVGIVQGIENLTVIDIDGLDDFDILPQLLSALGLPEDYQWITESGSGRGLHITFRLDNPALLTPLYGDKGVLVFKFREENICDHIEIRLRNCQTAFPPSIHPETRSSYSFYDPGHQPGEKPVVVQTQKLIEMINKFCLPPDSPAGHKKNPTPNLITSFDRGNLRSALAFLSQKLVKGSYYDWFRIGMALVTLGDEGEELFAEMSITNPHYRDNEDEVRAKFRHLAATSKGSITLSSIYFIAEKYGWKKPVIKFWSIAKNKVRISEIGFQTLLQSEGFCKIMVEKEYILARVKNYVVEETSIPLIKDFVKEYIMQIPAEELDEVTHEELLTTLIKSSPTFFTPQFLEFLITYKIDFIRDTADKSVIFYRNGPLVVTKEGVKLYNYSTFGKYIWKSQLLDRDFVFSDRPSHFEQFLRRVVREKEDRFNALISAIGYLLHRHKNPSNARAIVFMDEQNSEGAYGRCGKGLVIQAISRMRKTILLDGRNFSPSKNFAFQRIDLDTDLLALEDLDKRFPFDKLFSVITEGITVERKNKNEFFITFSESPKIVLSTNFSIPGLDDSTLARQFVIEFSNYYNMHHRPIDDFTKIFFHEWDESEWLAFDNFMVACLKAYLQKGLVHYKFVNLDQKRLTDATSPEFIEFIEYELGNSIDLKFNKKELFNSFTAQYPDFNKIKQHTLTRWLKSYAQLKGFDFTEKKSSDDRIFQFIVKENNVEQPEYHEE